MKKIMRVLTLITILLIQCFLLSGCDTLDELRDRQAIYNSARHIEYHGNTYMLLPACEDLQPIVDYSISINATYSDVPVLLSSMLSKLYLYESVDERFLVSSEGAIYCIEGQYSEIATRIESGFNVEKACYYYSTYNKETGEYEPDYYILTDEQFDAIKDIIKTTESSILPDSVEMNYNHIAYIEVASDDILFRKDFMDLLITDNDYYFRDYSDDGSTILYTIPDEYKDIIAEILAKCIEADNSFDYDYAVEETL